MNSGVAHGPKFEEAIHVTPLGHNRYSALLQNAFCIGTGTIYPSLPASTDSLPSLSLSLYTYIIYYILIKDTSPSWRLHKRSPIPPRARALRNRPPRPV
ncbi:hypothetical protein BJX76DRAFT_336077 [Aspergillus varians]